MYDKNIINIITFIALQKQTINAAMHKSYLQAVITNKSVPYNSNFIFINVNPVTKQIRNIS